ncbi:MAG TPA: hypothetical protein VMV33_17485 [Rhodocyclaceae bacterium]|nr:hypothetical protein [Rhodocyclaceae bacterium]
MADKPETTTDTQAKHIALSMVCQQALAEMLDHVDRGQLADLNHRLAQVINSRHTPGTELALAAANILFQALEGCWADERVDIDRDCMLASHILRMLSINRAMAHLRPGTKPN